MKYLKRIHLSACGLSLAIASLGNLLGGYATFIKVVCGVASFFVLTLITLKILTCRRGFMDDIRNADIAGVFPTYFMTVMTLSTYISISVAGFDLTKTVWLIGSMFHVSFAVAFFKNHALKFDINTVMPNWFITFVAYALAGIAAPMYGIRILGQILVIAGLCSYFILFPIILYRVLVIKKIPDNLKPVIWLFNSPINICIVAYISSFSSVNPVFLIVLLLFSMFSLGLSICCVGFKQIIRNGFITSVSAFTFPTVIFVTAIRDIYYFFRSNGYFYADLSGLIVFLEIAAALVVFGIFASYAVYVLKPKEEGI